MGELLGGYSGPFSSTTEWHAFGIGVYEGLKDFKDWDGLGDQAKRNPDVQEEIHYAKGGYVVGSAVRVGFYVVLASYGAPMFL